MQTAELEALRKRAQEIIDADPELKLLQAKFKRFGCSEMESLGATLGRAFSRVQETS
jgi:hypothetical protein